MTNNNFSEKENNNKTANNHIDLSKKDNDKKKIYNAISEIDDDLIEEARPKKSEKKRPDFRKWMAAAAAILVFILGVPFLLNLTNLMPGFDEKQAGADPAEVDRKDQQAQSSALEGQISRSDNYGPHLAVNYPGAYAFEDYETRQEIREQNPLSEDFLRAVNDFSFRTAAAVLSENQAGENANYSPLSLYYALAIAGSGAGSETAVELLDLLGTEDAATLNDQSGNLYRRLYFDNEIGKFQMANSLWLDNDFNGQPIEYKDDFVKNAAENYYASSHSVDFSDPETATAMAGWVADNTNGTLQPEVEIDSEQIFSIINTVYFRDQWIVRFDAKKTEPGIFHLVNGEEVEIDFMHQIFGTAGFTVGDGFTRAGLSLKNGGTMHFILPDEGVSPYELISAPEKLEKVLSGGEQLWGEVVWQIPKFDFDTKLDLIQILQKLGINNAFTPEADFSGIT
ncbi:MAG: serpin family protein, partial [Fastidiosipila sp.]|nr:serpin family protein [Fastidiosipila sp.]